MRTLFTKIYFISLVQILVSINSHGQYAQMGKKLVGSGAIGFSNQGISLSLSSNGQVMAVGGNNDNSGIGAVWVYTLSGSNWIQMGNKLVGTGYVGAPNQGNSVSLSADGQLLAVGGYFDNSNVGAVWIFTLSGGNWTQMGNKLVGTGYLGTPYQGTEVSLSGDGNTVAFGAFGDDSYVGAAWVFTLSGGNWNQVGSKLVGIGSLGIAAQGSSVCLSHAGNVLGVGGYYDNNQVGAVWVYTLSGSNWQQMGSKLVGTGYVGGSNQGNLDELSISSDGTVLACGGYQDDFGIGAIWVYTLTGSNWTQMGNKLVGTGSIGIPNQGNSSISANGKRIVVGGSGDNYSKGAIWVYSLTGSNWSQMGNKLVGSGAVGNSYQGGPVGISQDGSLVAVGGNADSSNTGAAWVFQISTTTSTVKAGIINTELNSIGTSVFPNPFVDNVNISATREFTYSIFDQQGIIVETGTSLSNYIGYNLKPGVYQLKVDKDIFKVVKIPR